MISAIPPTSDIRQGMLRAYRFTLQMPACVRTCATGLVDPSTSGTSSPPEQCAYVRPADAFLTGSISDFAENGFVR
jgi:hypothetical protein